LNSAMDSLSVEGMIQFIESHSTVALIALVLFVIALIVLGKIARWVIRPVLKGVLVGAIIFAALYFLSHRELLTITTKWMILISVGLAVITAIVDLNRKE